MDLVFMIHTVNIFSVSLLTLLFLNIMQRISSLNFILFNLSNFDLIWTLITKLSLYLCLLLVLVWF